MVEQHAVDVERRSVRYRVVGTGEPLVLVHGLSGSWRWWSRLLELLAVRRRVHVVDLPPVRHPVRAAELSAWLVRWLDAVGLERADIAGHSLGGLVAAELAATHPERVRRLVLVAPAGIPCGRSLTRRAVPLVGTLYAVRRSLPMITADALRTGPLAMARGIAFVSSRDLRADLAGVRAPTLLVWGERDRLVPPRIADEWQQLVPDVRLVYLPCGHVPMLEAPRQLAECMLAFLDEEPAHDASDQLGTGVLDRVGLAGDGDEPPAR